MNFSLPALKLTKHHKIGSQSVSYLSRTLPGHQGTESSSSEAQIELNEDAYFDSDDDLGEVMD